MKKRNITIRLTSTDNKTLDDAVHRISLIADTSTLIATLIMKATKDEDGNRLQRREIILSSTEDKLFERLSQVLLQKGVKVELIDRD